MDEYYNRRQDIISVMQVEEDVARVCKVIYTGALAFAALAVAVLTLFSYEFPIMTISNDFEYVWDIKGKMLMSGINVDGCSITTFNPLMAVFYGLAAIAAVTAVIYIVWNIIHASRAKYGETKILTGKPYRRLKTIIGGALTIDSIILLLFEPVYCLTKTSEGIAKIEELSANFSFNNYPTGAGVLLMIGCFFTGTYFLCSAFKDTKGWKKYQGLIYIAGIVALALYFWQYGYLHKLFGIDPATASFPYPFPKALNSFSKFTGSIKGTYNSVFGSLGSIFFTSGSSILNDSIIYNATTTVSAMLIGFVLGGAVGYIIAIIASCSERWGKGILTICTILVSFPVVALGPIVNHWFPSNSYMLSWIAKIIVVTILCMAGMSVNAYKGLTVMKPFTLDLMSICNADAKTTLLKLRIPNSLPNVFTALKTNSATALMGAFVCEFYSLSKTFGIGMMFNNYWSTARYQSWAYIIMAIIFGLILYLIVVAAEKKALAWYVRLKKK